MKIDIDKIHPNPFRDFSIYPIDLDHIAKLSESLADLGFFQSVSARPHPEIPGEYQLGGGHHRVEAAKQAGLKEAEVTVSDFTDEQLIDVMIGENVYQKGSNAAAILDSVAAKVYIITKTALIKNEQGEVEKIFSTSGRSADENIRTKLLNDGPGYRTIYHSINRFNLSDLSKNKNDQTLTEAEVRQAVTALKASGDIARIVGKAFKEVEGIRNERDQLEKERREAEEIKQNELKAQQLIAEEKAEAARIAAQEAERKANEVAESERVKAIAEANELREAAEFAEINRKEIEEEQKRQQQELNEKHLAEDNERIERQERENEERRKIEEMQKLEGTYDIRCIQFFAKPSHELAFRSNVLSERGKKFIPKEQQFNIAKMMVGSTANQIEEYFQKKFKEIEDQLVKENEEEQRLLLEKRDKARIEKKWTTLRLAMEKVDIALLSIKTEIDGWDDNKAFPVESYEIHKILETTDFIRQFCDTIQNRGKRRKQPLKLVNKNDEIIDV